MGELIIYKYGNNNYNIFGNELKYRNNACELTRVSFTSSNIYENKTNKIPKTKLYTLYTEDDEIKLPINNIYFKSKASVERYLKSEEGENIIKKYGKLGEKIFIDGAVYSECDCRAN